MLQLQSQSHVYIQGGSLSVSLARSEFEIEEAQRLRYKVFAEEMGANIVSDNGLDTDRYDEHCQHLLVRERENDRIIGCYRLLTAESAAAVGGWYSANEAAGFIVSVIGAVIVLAIYNLVRKKV